MKNENIVKLFIVVLLGMGICYFFLRKQKTNARKNQFVVGMTAGYAPWVSINSVGEYEGFDIDIARVVARQMNKTLVLQDLGSMAALFVALEYGKIDAIIWGLSITQDRLKKVAMINYQGSLVTSYPLLFWKAIPDEVKSVADMAGKTVCVEPASSQEAVMRKYDFITLLSTEKVDDALLNLQYGKADAAMVEPAIAKKFKNKYPEIQMLDVALDPQDQVQGVGIVMKKNNVDLIKQVDDAVAVLKDTRVIAQLEQKWDMLP